MAHHQRMREPCVIDIEASGFGHDSYPIEVGYVLADGRARCMLVAPVPGWTHWDESAAQVHGITGAALQAHGAGRDEPDPPPRQQRRSRLAARAAAPAHPAQDRR